MAIKITSKGKSSYTSSDHSKEHVSTSSGSSIPKSTVDTAIKNGSAYKNTVTAVNSATGESKVYEGYVINGVTWDSSGNRIVPGGNANQSGLIPGKTDIDRNTVKGTTTVTYYDPKKPQPPDLSSSTNSDDYSPPSYDDGPSYPPAPSQPMYEVFSVPQPTFNSDLQRVHKFTYFFGIDKVEVKTLELNQNCCRITREIEIGEIDHLILEASDSVSNNSSIEYSIIDGDKEVPILPNQNPVVTNEKVFYGLPTRFEVDETKAIIVKKDGAAVDIDFSEAAKKSDGLYTISYTAKNESIYKPVSTKVKLKFVLRLYDKTSEPPYIAKANLKLVGGNTLWQENT